MKEEIKNLYVPISNGMFYNGRLIDRNISVLSVLQDKLQFGNLTEKNGIHCLDYNNQNKYKMARLVDIINYITGIELPNGYKMDVTNSDYVDFLNELFMIHEYNQEQNCFKISDYNLKYYMEDISVKCGETEADKIERFNVVCSKKLHYIEFNGNSGLTIIYNNHFKGSISSLNEIDYIFRELGISSFQILIPEDKIDIENFKLPKNLSTNKKVYEDFNGERMYVINYKNNKSQGMFFMSKFYICQECEKVVYINSNDYGKYVIRKKTKPLKCSRCTCKDNEKDIFAGDSFTGYQFYCFLMNNKDSNEVCDRLYEKYYIKSKYHPNNKQLYAFDKDKEIIVKVAI